MIFGGNDQAFLEYPQPHYAKMRARGPVLRVPGAVQTTTRAALDTALRNAEVYSSGMEGGAPLGVERPLIPLQIDPPDHVRYRRLLDPLFAPKRMAALESRTAALVHRRGEEDEDQKERCHAFEDHGGQAGKIAH